MKRFWEPQRFCQFFDNRIALMTYNWTTTSDGAMKQIQKNAQFKIEASVDENGSLGPNTIKAMNAAQDQNQLLQNID